MEGVLNPVPRSTVLAERPKTVQYLDTIRLGHSAALDRHKINTCAKYGPRDRPILQQRYPNYPVAVPDVSKEATEETQMRRKIHGELYDLDPTAFRRKFYPECTADVFHQKHLVRDYLATMHPYSDPNDHGRTYHQSRLKSRGSSRDATRDDQRPSDFIQPDDPVRPRSTGYGKGHIRNMLSLDTYGEKSSEEVRLQRELGLLPPSPNTDRYRNMPQSPSSSTSTASSMASIRRPHTTGTDYPRDSADIYMPILQTQSSNNQRNPLAESDSFAVLDVHGTIDHFAMPPPQSSQEKSRGKVKVAPGTIGYVGPAITKEEVLMKDPMGKGIQFYQTLTNRKQKKLEKSQMKVKEQRRAKELQREAEQAKAELEQFEHNLRLTLAQKRPL